MPLDSDFTHETGSVVSGVTTYAELEPARGPKGLRVTWIAWDSGLRGSGLAIGDLIVKVDDQGLGDVLQPGKFGQAIGQANDSLGWEKLGARAGQPVTLTVQRVERQLEFTGQLVAERLYRDAKGASALAPGGPPALASDGFDQAWSRWAETIVDKMSSILDGSWERQSLDTRRELAALLEERPRVDFLLKTYPGPFAEAMRADWQQTLECLSGIRLDHVDLEYRNLGGLRLEATRTAAQKAWDDLRASLATQTIPAFPVPPTDQRSSFAGKVVFLPPLGPRNWISDLGRSFAVASEDGTGAYFVALSRSPAFNRFYEAQQRFRTQVSTRLDETWEFAGAILPDPIMLTVDDAPRTGFVLDLFGVRAGAQGECAVDLRERDTEDRSLFAGEATLQRMESPVIGDDASPSQVIEAMVAAVKFADEKRWKSLFATWSANAYEGRTLYDASGGLNTNLL